MADVRARLGTDLPDLLRRLGFRDDDAADAVDAAAEVLDSPADLARVQTYADRLSTAIGDLRLEQAEDPWPEDEPAVAHGRDLGAGVLAMLALVATAEDVHDYHRSRAIDDDISWRSLSDLGQQVWVHRLTYDSFGLHTQGWLRIAWSGDLYWLGRLQFNLQLNDGEWVLSTHIPRTGPLTPESVQESFRAAVAFFGRHFAEFPVRRFWCSSWLLDPQLTEVLAADSNMVRFQRLWQLDPEEMEGDGDALFFTFARRGDVDLDSLPQDTTLQRAIVKRLKSGGHWYARRGSYPLPDQSA
ncbi:acyltransferase domain-containing protein [Microlunatus panaciterrae]|uniref:GNAT-like C-terminal domain-containing protein n=1 Tax=Microlunatus panaciterrae TaxID=400768 RepID=A0ABS2RFX6_9ACTN|nr:acyltransferase domain-containing protein [Microlunatus panaciterrae]MBM7797908.1 hypothetical protein [Microlunatus panaciterrae]